MIRRSRRLLISFIGGIFKKGAFWWITLILLTLAGCGYLTLTYWPDLQDGTESLSSTVRNVSLIIGGIIAVELALWRSVIGLRQVDTAQRGLLNERLQKGAEMLGSKDLSVRFGGIYALHQLGEEYPDIYHIQVMKLLCAFIRHPTEDEALVTDPFVEEWGPRADLVAVVEIICKRSNLQIQIEQKADFILDLKNADLNKLSFKSAYLSEADFFGAMLIRTSFENANLTGAKFADATFSKKDPLDDVSADQEYLKPAELHTDLREADVSGASFSLQGGSHPARGLLQARLNQACAEPGNEPNLKEVLEPVTRMPLVWKGHMSGEK